MSVLWDEMTLAARYTVRSGTPFWTAAFNLESGCPLRGNSPPRWRLRDRQSRSPMKPSLRRDLQHRAQALGHSSAISMRRNVLHRRQGAQHPAQSGCV